MGVAEAEGRLNPFLRKIWEVAGWIKAIRKKDKTNARQ